jgi:hypothetical protein
MLKIILTAFMPLLLFFSSRDDGSPNASSAANTSPSSPGQSGTLQNHFHDRRVGNGSFAKTFGVAFCRCAELFLSGSCF